MGILATAVSLWSSHHGTVRTLFIVAGIGMLAGGVSLAWANDTSLVPVVCIASTALGITLGANITGGQFALFAQARPAHIGVASGLLRTFTYLGSIGASVISGMLFQQTANDVGMHAIGLVVVVLGIVVVAITIGDRSLRA
jgi:MFS family permease